MRLAGVDAVHAGAPLGEVDARGDPAEPGRFEHDVDAVGAADGIEEGVERGGCRAERARAVLRDDPEVDADMSGCVHFSSRMPAGSLTPAALGSSISAV